MRGAALIAIALCVVGCGDPAPRFGEATISAASPRATFSGTTFGSAAAMELAPGCPGYLDVETPGHVVHVGESVPFDITARSDIAPLALAVAHGDEVRCDSDEGSGHAPTLSFEEAGDYQVFVAALREPAELAYEITVRAGDARAEPLVSAPTDGRVVNVTITSQPPGAQVREQGGRVVGTTPAMFTVTVPDGEADPSRTWTLSLPEHQDVSVGGRLETAALVLHGQLPSIGPVEIDVSATEAQPIRDYQSAALGIDVGESCAITDAEVEVDIQHSFVGDLRVILRTPWDEEIMLQRHAGGGRRNLQRTWSSAPEPSTGRRAPAAPTLASLVGRNTQGRWTLVVHDDAGADEGSFDRFDLRLTCGSPTTVAVADPTPVPPVRDPTPTAVTHRPVVSNLPELPTRSDIVRVLGALRPRVEACGTGQGGSARVIATVTGSTGRVTQVSANGLSDPNVQRCVVRTVRTATFPRFRRQSLDVDYTYALR
ncbi:MAG: proprotein convertase P-domain-containing protein [Sandaracinaceae bacterium]|nr:proprotein convertase P-domain-containing protein [Sandaracinaceae bacterium]